MQEVVEAATSRVFGLSNLGFRKRSPSFPKNCRYFKRAKIILQNRRKEEEEEEIHSRELFQKTSTVFA